MPFSTFVQNLIRKKSGVRPEDEAKLLEFFSQIDSQSRVEIMGKSYQTFRKYITDKTLQKEHFSALQYAALLEELRLARRSKPTAVLNLKALAKVEQKKNRKEPKLHRLIRVKYFPEIKKLKDNGKSWKFICNYLEAAHKIKISHTYLIKIIKSELYRTS
jgi:hypothetical protein